MLLKSLNILESKDFLIFLQKTLDKTKIYAIMITAVNFKRFTAVLLKGAVNGKRP